MRTDPGARDLADRAGEWALSNRAIIGHVFDALKRDLDWLNVDTLQRELDATGSDDDLLTLATQIPPELGVFDWTKRTIALKLRAVRALPAAQKYLQFVFLVVYTAVGIYRNPDVPSVISSSDLQAARHMAGIIDEKSWVLCMRFLEVEEFYIFAGGTGSLLDAEWTRPLDTARIRRYLQVQTIDDYLLATAQLHWETLPRVTPNTWPLRPSNAEDDASMSDDSSPPATSMPPIIINVHGGTVGQLNVAEAVRNVNSRITAIGGMPQDLVEALHQFTHALETNRELDDETRAGLVEHWEQVVEEVEKSPSERRLRRLRTVLSWLREGVAVSGSLLDLYQKLEPSLFSHLGLPGQ